MTERLTLTVPEAAALLGVSRGVAYQGVRDGTIPSLKIGNRIVVPKGRLLELLGVSDPESATPAVAGVNGVARQAADAAYSAR